MKKWLRRNRKEERRKKKKKKMKKLVRKGGMKKNSASKEMMMEHRDRIYIYIAYIWDSTTMEMSRITCKNYCTYLQLITYVQLATAAAVPWPLFKTCMRQLVRTTSTPISIQQLVIWSLLWWLIEREASAVGIHAIMMYLIHF